VTVSGGDAWDLEKKSRCRDPIKSDFMAVLIILKDSVGVVHMTLEIRSILIYV
jgi:hypothetical protein